MKGKDKHGSSVNGGFTLIELMIVLAIIGILSAMAIPNMLRMAPHYRLVSAGTALQADIEYALSRATRTNAMHCMINISETGYEIHWDEDQDRVCNAGSPIIVHAAYEGIDENDKGTHFYPGIRLDTTSVALTFTPLGTVEDGSGNLTEADFTVVALDLNTSPVTTSEWMCLDVYAAGVVEIEGPNRSECD